MGWWNAVKRTAASVTTPTTGRAALFFDSASGHLAAKDENGVVMLLAPQAIHLRRVVSGALTAAAGVYTFRMPYKFLLTEVIGNLGTAQAADGGGGILTIDLNEAGGSVFSTLLTIDNTEKTSVTALTPAVISDATLAKDAEMTIDVDQIGDGSAADLDLWLIGYPIG